MPDVGCGKTLCNSAFEFEFNPLVFVMRVTPRIIVRLLSYQTDRDGQLDSETFNFMPIHNSDTISAANRLYSHYQIQSQRQKQN